MIRRSLARLADRAPVQAYRPPKPNRTRRRSHPAVARGALALGHVWMLIDQPRRAQRWFERANTLDATHGGAAALIRSLLAGGPDGVRRTPNLGLEVRPIGDPGAAQRVFLAVPKDGTPDAELTSAFGRAHIELQDFDAAISTAGSIRKMPQAASRTLADALELAARDRRGRAMGGNTIQDARRMSELFASLVASTPGDAGTRHRFVRHLVQMGEFRRARQLVWADDPTVTNPLAPTPGPELEPTGPGSGDWRYALHAELASEGRMTESHEVKLAIAQQFCRSPLPHGAAARHLVERVQAESYLGGPRAGLATLEKVRIPYANRTEYLTFAKLRGDLELSMGRPERLREVRSRLAKHDQSAHDRFDRVVRGARVVVIGPAPFGRPTDSDIASADVVVTTKRRPEGLPAALPSITYMTDASARLDQAATHADLERFPTHHVVLRPSMLAHSPTDVLGHPRLRVMQAEDTNTFLGTRFGIQRILYDLIGFDPDEVVLSGVDFFLSPMPYIRGYDNELADVYGPRGLQPVRSVAPHDHLWDFEFTQAMRAAGLVRASAEIDVILDLSPRAYLERVGTAIRSNSGDSHGADRPGSQG